jgi:signal transduction histidine kinase
MSDIAGAARTGTCNARAMGRRPGSSACRGHVASIARTFEADLWARSATRGVLRSLSKPASSAGAVLVFDGSGHLVAASPGAAAIVGPATTLPALAAGLVQRDGAVVDLRTAGSRVAVHRDQPDAAPITLRVEPLEARNGADVATAVIVAATLGEDDSRTVQHVLGSVLAHELRTPLTTIFGGAQLIADPHVTTATKEQAAGSVTREAEHLHRIVEDLVELVRGGMDDQELEPVLVQRTLARVVSAIQALRPEARIDLHVESALPPVLAIEMSLDHLLTNVIAHALTYATDDAVSVTAGTAGGHVEIRVIDDGPGRDRHDAEGAFELFHHSPRTMVDRSGANVSLAVTRRIAERIGVRIRAEERPEGGETVLTLPIAGVA